MTTETGKKAFEEIMSKLSKLLLDDGHILSQEGHDSILQTMTIYINECIQQSYQAGWDHANLQNMDPAVTDIAKTELVNWLEQEIDQRQCMIDSYKEILVNIRDDDKFYKPGYEEELQVYLKRYEPELDSLLRIQQFVKAKL